MKSIWVVLGSVVVPVTIALAGDVVPSNRLANRTVGASDGYGVPGGIYQYRARTVVPATGLTDTTGGTDYSASIQAQIDALAENQCLLLPAGTFKLSNGINVGRSSDGQKSHKNITLRGAGPGATILKTYGTASVSCSGSGGFPTYYPANATLTADTPAGSTTLTLSESFADAVGTHALIDGVHDPAVPLVSVAGFPNLRPSYVRLVGASGNTATFFPALPFDLKAGSRITRENGGGAPPYLIHTDGIAIEDLTVDGQNSSSSITVGFFNTRFSWLYNVEVKNVKNYGISAAFNLQSSIIHCSIHDHEDSYPSVTSRNLLLMAASTLVLVEDNLIFNGWSATELNSGVTLSAFSHNFCDRINIRDTLSSAFNINHGPHNSFNVYEGNIASRIQSDGYFGSASDETFHRNWFHGTSGVYTTDWATGTTVLYNRLPITLNRFNRRFNIVGNQIGRTGTGITWLHSNAGVGFDTTSTSSVSIGTGDKIFTFGTGLGYHNNGSVALVYSASSPNNWMMGRVWGYNDNISTGACKLSVTRYSGSGTFNDWVVKGGGGYGTGASDGLIYALGGPNIGGGGFFGDFTIVLPQTRGIWWRVWDGTKMVRRGAYNSSTAYTVGDVVDMYGPGQTAYTGGNDVFAMIAVNAAKNGSTSWETPNASATDWRAITQNSFQELDYDVYATSIFKDNWTASTAGIHPSEALGGSETYPVSRIRSGSTRPNFFGSSLTYPAFDSHSPNQSFTAIPAGHRYIYFKNNGTWVNSDAPGYNPDDAVAGYTPPTTRRMPSIQRVQSVVQ